MGKPRQKGDIFFANIHVPKGLEHLFGGRKFLGHSYETSDKFVADALDAELRKRISEAKLAVRLARQADKLSKSLPANLKAVYDHAGGIEELKAAHQATEKTVSFLKARSSASASIDAINGETSLFQSSVKALIEFYQEAHDQQASTLLALSQRVTPIRKAVRSVSLSDIATAIVKTNCRSLDKQYAEKFQYAVRRFEEWHGAIPLEELQRRHLSEFSTALLKLPKSSSRKIRPLKMKDAIRIAEESGLPRIGEITRRNILTHLKTLTSFAVNEGYMEPPDPFIGYSPPSVLNKKAPQKQKKRLPFTVSQARKILDAAANRPETLDSWAPMIALYQGARREEIAQLRPKDVTSVDGVDCFVFTDEGDNQRLKNEAALRTVPVHPALIRGGLLDLVEQRKIENGLTLFQECISKANKTLRDLRPDNRGRLSEAYGKRFAHMLDTISIDDDRLVFHSFRHTWEDAADSAALHDSHRRQLAGRAARDPVQGRYGIGASMPALLESLKKVDPLRN